MRKSKYHMRVGESMTLALRLSTQSFFKAAWQLLQRIGTVI